MNNSVTWNEGQGRALKGRIEQLGRSWVSSACLMRVVGAGGRLKEGLVSNVGVHSIWLGVGYEGLVGAQSNVPSLTHTKTPEQGLVCWDISS